MSPQVAFAAALPTQPDEPWMHDPSSRAVVSRVGDWEVRVLPRRSQQFPRPNRRNDPHVQLWHPRLRLSVITPNRLTANRFEVQLAGKRTWRMARTAALHPFVALLAGVDLPRMREIAMLAEWFGRSQARHGRRHPQTARTRAAQQRPGSKRRAGSLAASTLLAAESSSACESSPPDDEPLGNCLVASLRHLIAYLAVADSIAMQRLVAGTPFANPSANLCERIISILSMTLHSPPTRRQLNRLLAQRLRVAAASFDKMSLSTLADFWMREAANLTGRNLAALLWVVAQRSDPCHRKLEAKITRRIDLDARWALLDASDWP